MSENALEGTLGRTKISEYTTPPMNALVTALPGLVIIFVLAGGVNALAGVLLLISMAQLFQMKCNSIAYLRKFFTFCSNQKYQLRSNNHVLRLPNLTRTP